MFLCRISSGGATATIHVQQSSSGGCKWIHLPNRSVYLYSFVYYPVDLMSWNSLIQHCPVVVDTAMEADCNQDSVVALAMVVALPVAFPVALAEAQASAKPPWHLSARGASKQNLPIFISLRLHQQHISGANMLARSPTWTIRPFSEYFFFFFTLDKKIRKKF